MVARTAKRRADLLCSAGWRARNSHGLHRGAQGETGTQQWGGVLYLMLRACLAGCLSVPLLQSLLLSSPCLRNGITGLQKHHCHRGGALGRIPQVDPPLGRHGATRLGGRDSDCTILSGAGVGVGTRPSGETLGTQNTHGGCLDWDRVPGTRRIQASVSDARNWEKGKGSK